MWRDILCAFGLGVCTPVQPDVSAHTILHLFAQTHADPGIMPLAFGALYEQVVPEAGGLQLWRGGRMVATTHCTRSGDTPVSCRFSYRDGDAEIDAFLQQASAWAVSHSGPLAETEPGTGWRAESQDPAAVIRHVTLTRPAQGADSEAILIIGF